MSAEFVNPSSDIVFAGSGYMHQVFRQGDFVYKRVKPEFSDRNNASHFETEQYSLDLLRRSGFPTPSTCEVIPPGVFFKDDWALRESYIDGVQYRDGEMPQELEAKVCDSLLQMAQEIVSTSNSYGRIASDARTAFRGWKDYLFGIVDSNPYARKQCPLLTISNAQIKKLIERIVPDDPAPSFIAMDTNLMNYFFNRKDTIVGIIDVDRPIWGDVAYLYADIRWNRDHWFHRPDWYENYIASTMKTDVALVDVYEFVIAYEEIDERYRKGKLHSTMVAEVYALEKRLKDLV